MEYPYPDYKITKYIPEFREQVLSLQTHLWGQDLCVNDTYFQWKYEQNPYHEVPNFHVALYKDKIVGMRGLIGNLWEVNHTGQQHKWLALADSIVHPDHRRHGLFAKISNAEVNEFSNSLFGFIVNLSTGPMSTSSNLRLGWRSPGANLIADRTAFHAEGTQRNGWKEKIRRLPGVYKVYRLIRDRAKSLTKTDSIKLTPLERFDMNFEKHQTPFSRISLSDRPKPTDMANLVKSLDYDGRIRHARDEKYFSWRFNNPRSVYRFLFYEQEGMKGYLVLRCPKGSGAMAIGILDLEAVDQETWKGLLQAAITWGKESNISLWATTLAESKKNTLQHLGFQVASQRVSSDNEALCPSVLIRPLKINVGDGDWHVGGRSLLDINNWDLRAIYADGF